jgi:ABC transport system ATP-binding/permease protein
VDAEGPLAGGSGPPLLVRAEGSDRSLPAGHSYLVGRDPGCDIVITDARVSWHHAVLTSEGSRWVLADNGSTNGTYAGDWRVDRIEIAGECLVRLGHPADGPVLSCTVSAPDHLPTRLDILPGGDDVPGPPGQPLVGDDGAVPPAQPLAGERVAALPGLSTPGPEQVLPAGEPSVVRPLPAGTLRIGRAEDNDIVVADPAVSRHHAELRNVGGQFHLVDLGSNNGTFVNGQRITAAPLSAGDVVVIGTSTFRLAGQELQEFSASAAAGEAPPALAPPVAPPAPVPSRAPAAPAPSRAPAAPARRRRLRLRLRLARGA